MVIFSDAAQHLDASTSSNGVVNYSQPADTTREEKTRYKLVVRIEFRSIPTKNKKNDALTAMTFNVAHWMNAVVAEMFKTNLNIFIHQPDSDAYMDKIDQFPHTVSEFKRYFPQTDSDEKGVYVSLTFSAFVSLAEVKCNKKFHDFLTIKKIWMLPQSLETLKMQCLGWFFGQSKYVWCPTLKEKIQKCLYETKFDMEREDDDGDTQPESLMDIELPPKFNLVPGNTRYYHKVRNDTYTTFGVFLWCEKTKVNEMNELLTKTEFPADIGKFIPAANPPPSLVDVYFLKRSHQ